MAKKGGSLTSDLKQFACKTLPGMNNKVENLELNSDTQTLFVETAQNCRFEDQPGAVVKRGPISYYNTNTIGSSPIVGLFRHYGSSNKKIAIAGTQAYVGDDSAGTWTSIRANLTSGKRASFITYKGITIVSNGFDDMWCYDGSSDNVTWELGSCKAVVGVSTGITATNISYQVVIDSHVCGAVSNTIASVTNQDITLTNIPLGPPGTTNRKIYRKDSGTASAYLLVTTIANNTATTYTDNTVSGSLGAAIAVVSDDMPKGSILQLHRERVFIAGDPSHANRIYYSNPYLPWYIQQTTNLDYMDIAPDDGDEIVGIPIQMGVMACIKKNTIRRVIISSPTSGFDPANWYAEDPSSYVGSPSQWSICQTPHGVVFLGWNHWYLWTGSTATPIIDEFDCSEILAAKYSNVFAYWLQQDILMVSYSDAETATEYNNRVMLWNFKRQALAYDVMDVNVICQQTGSNDNGEIIVGSSVQGFVYLTEVSNISYQLTTKTQANLGTKVNSYVGGTESEPYIQIGSVTSASAIPDNICILWDSAESPGSSWTEVTGFDGKFLKITTDTVGTTGTVGDNSSGVMTELFYISLRLFKKNSGSTLYQFPVGSIVFWDQPFEPTGYVLYADGGQYIKIDSTLENPTGSFFAKVGTAAGGTGIDNTVSFRFIKRVGEEDTWDGVSNYVYCPLYDSSTGSGWTDVASTYTGKFPVAGEDGPTAALGAVTGSTINFITLDSTDHVYAGPDAANGAKSIDGDTGTQMFADVIAGGSFSTSSTSDHMFAEPVNVDTIYLNSSCSGGNVGGSTPSLLIELFYKQDGDTSWTSVPGTQSTTSGGSGATSLFVDTTYTVNLTNVVAVRAYAYSQVVAGSGSAQARAGIKEVQAYGKYSFVTTRLAKKVLGQMQDYNAALTTPSTNGLYTSPGIQIQAQTLVNMFWNESKIDTDDIEFYTRTGSTQSSVENGTALTVDHTTDKFTAVGHGLSNGHRVQILGSVIPTGINDKLVYFVVGVSGNDFQVSLTSGGSAAAFSSNGTSVTFKRWYGPLSDPNGTAMTSAANTWISYLVAFTAVDTTAANPKIYFSDGSVLYFTYRRAATFAESSVEFIYSFGLRNFDAPMVDKIFKKILSRHEATSGGSLKVQWETENSSGEFVIDLSVNASRWESFFPDDAMGREIDITIYKNDNLDFKLKEISGIYTPEPVII